MCIRDSYKASPKIVNVGTASADPNVSAVIGAALATGDEATINAAVAPYAASAAAILNPAPVEQPSQEEQAITGTVDEKMCIRDRHSIRVRTLQIFRAIIRINRCV